MNTRKLAVSLHFSLEEELAEFLVVCDGDMRCETVSAVVYTSYGLVCA